MNVLYSAGRMIFTDAQIERIKSIDGVDLSIHIDTGSPPDCDVGQVEYLFNTSVFKHHDIAAFGSLKQIQLFSAGTDHTPEAVVAHSGLIIKRAADVYSIPIAEFVLMRCLEILKQARYFETAQANRSHTKNRAMQELYGKTAALIGYGSIGRQVAKRLKGFGVKTVGFSRSAKSDAYLDDHYPIGRLDEIIGTCDIVVVTMPYSEANDKMFDSAFFDRMKAGGTFINVSRGKLVDEDVLAACIRQGKLRGAALDVTYEEPLGKDSGLWTLENVYLSPHNSFVSEKIYDRLFELCEKNLKAYMKDKKNAADE